MTERLNIWGKPGCELPNGKLCNACCILPEIELEGTIVSVSKPANSPCPHLNDSGQGCSLHPDGKKEICKSWHCGVAGTESKINLIAQGLSSGLVSETDISDDIKNEVVGRSIIFSEITIPRDLVIRDLIEP